MAFAAAALAASLARAEEPQPEAPASPEPANASFARERLAHVMKLTALSSFGEPLPGADRVWTELEYRPRLTIEVQESARLVLEPLLRACAARATLDWSSTFTSCPDRQAAELKEVYLRLHGGLGDLGVGWQVFSWGKADGIRPLDVFQLVDDSDRLREETLGIPSASVTAGGEEWTIEGVWVPARMTSRVSFASRNPWSVLPRLDGVAVVAVQPPPDALDALDGEGGVRIGYSGHALDAAILSARGRDHVPTSMALVPGVDANGAPVLRAIPIYAAFTLFGATVAVPVSGNLLRLDAGIFLRDHPSEPFQANGVRLVAGYERREGFGSGGSILLIAQYIYDGTAPTRLEAIGGRVPSPFRLFQHGASVSVTVSLRDELLKIEGKGLLDVQAGAGILSVTVTYRPSDAARLWVGADYLGGPSTSMIGRLTGADRFLAGLEFHP